MSDKHSDLLYSTTNLPINQSTPQSTIATPSGEQQALTLQNSEQQSQSVQQFLHQKQSEILQFNSGTVNAINEVGLDNSTAMDNYSENNFMQESEMENPTEMPVEAMRGYHCSMCDSVGTPSTVYCFVCKDVFCEECNKIVHSNKFSGHNRKMLSELHINEISSIDPIFHEDTLGKCPIHKLDFVMYCKEDETFCCSECLMDTKHVGHDLFHVVTDYKTIYDAFCGRTGTIDATVESTRNNIELLEEIIKRSEKSYELSKEKIEKRFGTLRGIAEEKKRELLKKVDDLHASNQSKPDKQNDPSEKIKEAIEGTKQELMKLREDLEKEIGLNETKFREKFNESFALMDEEENLLNEKEAPNTFMEKLYSLGSKLDGHIKNLKKRYAADGSIKMNTLIMCSNIIISFMEKELNTIISHLKKMEKPNIEEEELTQLVSDFTNKKDDFKKDRLDLEKELETKICQGPQFDIQKVFLYLQSFNELANKVTQIRDTNAEIELGMALKSFRSEIVTNMQQIAKISLSIDQNSTISWTKDVGSADQRIDPSYESVINATGGFTMHTPAPQVSNAINKATSVNTQTSAGINKCCIDMFFDPFEQAVTQKEEMTVGKYRSILENTKELKPEMFSLPDNLDIDINFKKTFDEFNAVRTEFIEKYATNKAHEIFSTHLLKYLGIPKKATLSLPSEREVFRLAFVNVYEVMNALIKKVEEAPSNEFTSAHHDVRHPVREHIKKLLNDMHTHDYVEKLKDISDNILMIDDADSRLGIVDELSRQVTFFDKSYDGKKVTFLVPNNREDLTLRLGSDDKILRCKIADIDYYSYTFKEYTPSRAKEIIQGRISSDCTFPCWYVVLKNANDYIIVLSTEISKKPKLDKWENRNANIFVELLGSGYCYCDINSL